MQEKIKQARGGLGFLYLAAAFIITIAGMRAASSILIPFFLSIFVAVMCAPPLYWLKRKGVPTPLAVLLVIAAILAIGFIIVLAIGTSLNDFSTSLPLYQERLNDKTQLFFEWLERSGISLSSPEAKKALDPGAAMQMVGGILAGVKSILTKGFFILLTVIFILLEASGFPAKIKAIASDSEKTLFYFDKFMDNLQRYMVIKTAISFCTGVAITIWLSILGVDYPVLWGLLAFLLNYIPNIGSIIAAIPPVLLATVQFDLWKVGLVALGYLVVNIVVGSILEPRIMGRGLGISTLVVFLSLVFWGWVFGPIGMLLSVPLTMTAKIALDSNEETRWIAVLLGSDEEARKG
jgi:predicted PurR-regulated permease PerM